MMLLVGDKTMLNFSFLCLSCFFFWLSKIFEKLLIELSLFQWMLLVILNFRKTICFYFLRWSLKMMCLIKYSFKNGILALFLKVIVEGNVRDWRGFQQRYIALFRKAFVWYDVRDFIVIWQSFLLLLLQFCADDSLKKHVLSKTITNLHVIEFQKRGLSHAQILITLSVDDKQKHWMRTTNCLSAQNNNNTNM